MFRLFGRRATQKYNTVDLDDDLGDAEMLEAFEEIFGIKIEDREAQDLITVGQLYDLVSAKIASHKGFDPVWALAVQILREHSGSRDGIDRWTTFFPQHASERSEQD